MKSSIRVSNMQSTNDIKKIRNLIACTEGILACEIKKDKGLIDVVYDDYFLNIEDLKCSIEEIGFIII